MCELWWMVGAMGVACVCDGVLVFYWHRERRRFDSAVAAWRAESNEQMRELADAMARAPR